MAAKKAPAPIIETPDAPPEIQAAPEPTPEVETAGVTPPKKRGRKSNAEREALAAAGNPVSPSTSSGAKRGRPRKGAVSIDSTALAKQLQGLHTLGAMLTGIPEMQILPEEAALLADAVKNVAEEYDLELSGKTGAAIQLLATAAMIYVPRLLQVRQRAMQAAQQGAMHSDPTVN